MMNGLVISVSYVYFVKAFDNVKRRIIIFFISENMDSLTMKS